MSGREPFPCYDLQTGCYFLTAKQVGYMEEIMSGRESFPCYFLTAKQVFFMGYIFRQRRQPP